MVSSSSKPALRIGTGYDVHRLVEGRKLILGGLEIDHTHGLLGHSDADVLVHAIMDAMLGALALGDIGQHFPDTDPAYKDIDSVILLEKVRDLVADQGYRVSNMDCVIEAQKPKLAPHIPAMRKRIADCLGIGLDRVSIKATTTEELGFVGEKQGMASTCVCLLELMNQA